MRREEGAGGMRRGEGGFAGRERAAAVVCALCGEMVDSADGLEGGWPIEIRQRSLGVCGSPMLLYAAAK